MTLLQLKWLPMKSVVMVSSSLRRTVVAMVTVIMHQCPSARIDLPLTVQQCVALACPAPFHKPPQLSATDVTLMLKPACVESTPLHQIQFLWMEQCAMK